LEFSSLYITCIQNAYSGVNI